MELQNSTKSISPLPSMSISPIMASSEARWAIITTVTHKSHKYHVVRVANPCARQPIFSRIFDWSWHSQQNWKTPHWMQPACAKRGSIWEGLSFNPTASKSVSRSSAPSDVVFSRDAIRNTAWVLYKNSLYKNLRGSNPRRATYFQLYQAHSTLRIWGVLGPQAFGFLTNSRAVPTHAGSEMCQLVEQVLIPAAPTLCPRDKWPMVPVSFHSAREMLLSEPAAERAWPGLGPWRPLWKSKS